MIPLSLPYKAGKETTATLIKPQGNLWHDLCWSIPDRMMLTQRKTAYRREQSSVLFDLFDLKSDTDKMVLGFSCWPCMGLWMQIGYTVLTEMIWCHPGQDAQVKSEHFLISIHISLGGDVCTWLTSMTIQRHAGRENKKRLKLPFFEKHCRWTGSRKIRMFNVFNWHIWQGVVIVFI